MRSLRVLITSGPTREPLDPVRFISNRSSGKMGHALVEAARTAGHRVTLVSGPVALPPPRSVALQEVETAEEMRRAVMKAASRADVIIMAAAVADYRPLVKARSKIKKRAAEMLLRLQKTPDILAELGRRKRPGQILVGFAAETENLRRHAARKLKAKNLDYLVANRVGRKDSGFDSDHNRAFLLARDGGTRSFPLMSKTLLAKKLIALICPK